MLGIRELMNMALFNLWDEPITVGEALAGAAATTVLAAADVAFGRFLMV